MTRTTMRTVVSQKRERRRGESSTAQFSWLSEGWDHLERRADVTGVAFAAFRPVQDPLPASNPLKTLGCRLPARPPQPRVRRAYPILLISVNIGRYIAMTMPPMTMPRMKIMTGSSSLTRPATAMSTSSS